MGFPVPERARIARSWRNAASRRHAVRESRQGSLYFLGLRLVPRTARGRAGRVSLVRQHAKRGQGAIIESVSEPQRTIIDEPPPFLGTWKRVYWAVIFYLACVIGLFYWFTRSFSP